MYNQTSFIALVRQAIKKPLVTELLPRSSYPRGWRCEYNYDQFYWVGQVTHLFIPSPRKTRTENGDGFPASKPQITALCVRFFTAVAVCCVCIGLFSASPMVVRGPGSPFQQKQRTPGISSTWRSLNSLLITAYSLSFRRWRAISAKPLYWGGGYCTRRSFTWGKDSTVSAACQKAYWRPSGSGEWLTAG